jgi:hypothetical protein
MSYHTTDTKWHECPYCGMEVLVTIQHWPGDQWAQGTTEITTDPDEVLMCKHYQGSGCDGPMWRDEG